MEFPADPSVDSGAGTGRRGPGLVCPGLKTAGFRAALLAVINRIARHFSLPQMPERP